MAIRRHGRLASRPFVVVAKAPRELSLLSCPTLAVLLGSRVIQPSMSKSVTRGNDAASCPSMLLQDDCWTGRNTVEACSSRCSWLTPTTPCHTGASIACFISAPPVRDDSQMIPRRGSPGHESGLPVN